jgi:hypothetical protein
MKLSRYQIVGALIIVAVILLFDLVRHLGWI